MSTKIDLEELEPRSPWPRRFAIAAVTVVAGLIVTYFVASSSFFLKNVVLPRLADTLGAQITIGDSSISPFSQVVLRKFTLKTTGSEPLLTVEEVRARYSLFSILGGKIDVSEVTLLSPDIRIIEGPDGRSNLSSLSDRPSRPSPDRKGQPAPRLNIRNVSLKNGRVLLARKDKASASETREVSNLEFTLDRLENGQSGRISLGTVLRATQSSSATNGLLEAKVSSSFEFTLDPQLRPQTAKGNGRMDLSRTEGLFGEFLGLAAILQVDLSPTELRQFNLRFERGGQPLGRLAINGPFDVVKATARLKVDIQQIDRQVLNLLGAAHAVDFGKSLVNASGIIDLSRDWRVVVATGKIEGRQLGMTRNGHTTPPVELDLDYQLQIDLAEEAAVLQKLNLAGRREQKDMLTASLDKPMNINWGPRARGFSESNLRVALNQIDLSEWRSLIGIPVSGLADIQINILAQQDAKQLTARSAADFRNVKAEFGTNRLQFARARLETETFLTDFRTADIRAARIVIEEGGASLVSANVTGNYDLQTAIGNAQFGAEVSLVGLLKQFPISGASATSGSAKISSNYTFKENNHSSTGVFAVNDFTGVYGACDFTHFQAAIDYNLDLGQNNLQIHSASAKIQHGFRPGGSVDFTGKVNLTNAVTEATFKILELNQDGLLPFLKHSLGDNRLVSLTLNGTGSLNHNPSFSSSIKAELNFNNFLIQPPQLTERRPPVSARIEMDGALREEVFDLRQFTLALTPTKRATNEIQIQAKLDLSKLKPAPGEIRINAQALDLTAYYDMFASSTNTTAPAPATISNQGQSEPPAVLLPFSELTAGVKIDRLFLHEIAVTNFVANAKLQNGQLLVNPLQMTLNGAPVKASAALNLSQPGYVYDISFQADKVPIEPMANTFSPANPGRLKGDLNAKALIKGAGITGVNLRKNLTGEMALNITNMNYEVVTPKTRRLIEPIAFVLNLSDLLQSPLNWVDARVNLGQGQINLENFSVLSSAFHAESRGNIPISDVLTNSPLDLPVTLSLRRSLAEKSNLLPSNAPTNTAYVPLAQFVKLTGTLGNPKTQTDKLMVAGLVTRSVTSIIPKLGGKAAGIVQGVGNLLSGKAPDAPNVNSPEAVPAQRPGSAATLLQGIGTALGGRKQQSAPTNATPATSPASPASKASEPAKSPSPVSSALVTPRNPATPQSPASKATTGLNAIKQTNQPTGASTNKSTNRVPGQNTLPVPQPKQ